MALTQREKIVIIGGVVFLGLIIAFQIIAKPALHRVSMLKRVITEKQEKLDELHAKSREYNILQSQLDRIRLIIERQQKGRQVLSTVERIQKNCGLMQKVVYMTPSISPISDKYEKTNVEIKFGAVTLDQIIQFLLRIESSEQLIGINSVDIKHGLQNPSLLDAVIQVTSLSSIEQN